MFVSVATVRGIVAEVQNAGIAPESLLAQHGLTLQELADMQTMLPTAQFARIVVQAIALTGDPGLGLSVGAHTPEPVFQLLGQLALASPNLRTAMRAVERYSELLVHGMQIHLDERGGVGEFCFDFHGAADTVTARFGAECFSAVFTLVARRHFTAGKAPQFVGFRHAAPSYAERYGALFGCPVRFNQPTNSVAFEAAFLDSAPPYADSSMAAILTQAAEHMLRGMASSDNLSRRVQMVLRREVNLCSVDTTRLARDLGLSHRAMRRQLALEGYPWSRLLAEARAAGARAALQEPGSSIKEAAERLGYSEPSAFHRAFKRWTGQTPAEFVRARSAR